MISNEAIQQAVYTKIAVQQLSSALGGMKLYDRVPTGTKPSYPYVTFGNPVVTMIHGQQSVIQETLFQIDVWTRDGQVTGRRKAYQVQDILRGLLDRQPLTIAGATHHYTHERTVTILDETDGLTWHGVQVFAIGAGPA